MFEMVDSETIRPSSARVATAPDGLLYCMCSERCGVGVKGMASVEAALESAGFRVLGVRDYCSELFGKGGGYCYAVCEGFGCGGSGQW